MMNLEQAIDAWESDLIGGRARWIADLNEFFRDFQASDTTFALLAKGRTRNRGLFLSRFFAWTAMPNYSVSLFCTNETGDGHLTVEKIRKRIEAAFRMMKGEELHWAWLVVFSLLELPPSAMAFVSRYDRKELGLAVVSVRSQQMVVSNNQLGRSMGRHLGLTKLVGKLSHAKAD